MKTLDLVNVIDKKDIKFFRKHLADKKMSKTLALFETLYYNAETSKEELFVVLFRKKYTSEKDYLLRNEIRLLNTELENFIAADQLLDKENSFYKRYLILKKIKNGKEKNLFEKEWNDCFNEALSAQRELEQCILLLLKK